ncbi:MAG: penicillin acylase family protein [Pseudomonadota bacterium]
MFRAIKRIGIGVATLLTMIVTSALIWILWVLSANANYEKTLTVQGLSAPIEIYRDTNGVPHIFAETHHDALFALGYAQAQDRGWQMEFLRRAVDGQMSEIAGKTLVDLDIEFVASGAADLADLSYSQYTDDTKRAIDAFAAGINAAIDAGEYSASPEFRAFGVTPTYWTPRQVGALTYLIGSGFDPSSRRVLQSLDLVADLGEQRADLLMRDFEDSWPTLFRDIGELETVAERSKAALEAAELPILHEPPTAPSSSSEGSDKGTNFFLLGPTKTTTGAPILAVDPHLELDTPSFYYPAALNWENNYVRGAFWVTSPSIHFGHNRQIAWGMTALVVDNAHYILEKIDPNDDAAYVRPGSSIPFQTKNRTITVRGQKDPETVSLRYTTNGPVVSDFDQELQQIADAEGPNHAIVRKSATLLEGQFFLESGVAVQNADDWRSFRAAFQRHGSPNTVAYADTLGNIGVLTAAHVPIRKNFDAWPPLPRAWLDEGDWHGIAPFDALPHAYNPNRQWIADSNARIVPKNFPLFLTARASSPYRIKRSEIVLAEDRMFSIKDIQTLQTDIISTRPDVVLPIANELAVGNFSDHEQITWLRLMEWDRSMQSDMPEPLLYMTFEHALHQRLIGEKVSDTSYGNGRGDPITLARLLHGKDRSFWCDSIETDDRETCSEAVVEALRAAITALSEMYGSDINDWRWGDAHTARFGNRYFLDFIPVATSWAAREVEQDSGPGTLNVGAWSSTTLGNYSQNSGAVWRQIIDLSNLDNSIFQIAPGVSGNPSSQYYDSTLKAWRDGEYFSLALGRDALVASNAPLTLLEPVAVDD